MKWKNLIIREKQIKIDGNGTYKVINIISTYLSTLTNITIRYINKRILFGYYSICTRTILN